MKKIIAVAVLFVLLLLCCCQIINLSKKDCVKSTGTPIIAKVKIKDEIPVPLSGAILNGTKKSDSGKYSLLKYNGSNMNIKYEIFL